MIFYLIRHAKPAATWGEDPDPGLDSLGHTQASATAKAVAQRTPALRILTSPMQRCRETAQPLEGLWNRTAEVLAPVAEIPSPPLGLGERHTWLQQAITGTWAQLQSSAPPRSPDFLAWRRSVIASLAQLNEPAVIYTHFIAINAIVGAARGTDDVVCFRPDHASVTIVEMQPTGPRIVELGREANTVVLTRN